MRDIKRRYRCYNNIKYMEIELIKNSYLIIAKK